METSGKRDENRSVFEQCQTKPVGTVGRAACVRSYPEQGGGKQVASRYRRKDGSLTVKKGEAGNLVQA